MSKTSFPCPDFCLSTSTHSNFVVLSILPQFRFTLRGNHILYSNCSNIIQWLLRVLCPPCLHKLHNFLGRWLSTPHLIPFLPSSFILLHFLPVLIWLMFETQIRLYSVEEASVKAFGLNPSALSLLRNHSMIFFFYHKDKGYLLAMYLHCSALCEYKNGNTFLTLVLSLLITGSAESVGKKEGRQKGRKRNMKEWKKIAVTSNGRRRRSWSHG